ncbi:MAG: DNA cytosine methyltransferase [Gracilimonas sp.]
MNSLELFSGAGGLASGLQLAGFSHSAFIEFNKDACLTLRSNFKDVDVIETDIRNIDYSNFDNIDIIAGGPPCQPFSLGGKAKGNNDKRDMFPYAINGIRKLQPKAFLFENVKGLLRKSFSSYFNYIILQLTYPDLLKDQNESWINHLSRLEKVHTSGGYQGLKYRVVYRLLNSANYGVPQKRERVFIVGIREDLEIEWSFPEETHCEEKLLWDKFVSGEYWDKYEIEKSKREKLSPRKSKIIKRLKRKYGFFEPQKKPWVTVRQALHDLPHPNDVLNDFCDHVYKDGAKSYPGHTGSYIDEPSKTIKAGAHGVPGGENMVRYENGTVRYFTILETKRIQTFPDDYMIAGSWTEGMRQLGNAVPVKLSKLLAANLFQVIKKQNKVNSLTV